jgi:hypothetical protein
MCLVIIRTQLVGFLKPYKLKIIFNYQEFKFYKIITSYFKKNHQTFKLYVSVCDCFPYLNLWIVNNLDSLFIIRVQCA